MALSSYNELLKQVASLKSENCHLRRELQDNSSHLTKLENDASNMKDVLSHIQVTFTEQELNEHDFGVVQEDCGRETGAEDYNEDDDPILASHTSLCDDSFDDDVCQGQAAAVEPDEGETSMTESSGNQMVDVYSLFQKLDSERKQLMQELERDEQHRLWFYNQLKTITQKMEGLHSEKYSVQTDSARCQLEMEAHKVLGAMQEKLGSGEQSKLRQEARLGRIRSIETEIRSLPMPAKQSTKDVKDAATSTLLGRDVFKIKPGQEGGVGGFTSDRTSCRSGLSATVATQTGDVTLVEVPDGVAPGIPLSSNMMAMYHGAWPIDKAWTGSGGAYRTPPASQDLASVISFNSTNTTSSGSLEATSGFSQPVAAAATGEQSQNFGTKVEMVYSLLSMLGTHDKDDMSRTLFAMSQSQDSCIAMRQSGCLPLLLQLLHGSERDSGLLGKTRGSKAARARAAAALHNIVHCNHDDKRGRREARTLRLLEQIRAHCDQQRGDSDDEEEEAVVSNYSDMDHHPGAAIAALMKLSFDEDYRHAICTLGGLQAIAELLHVDNRANSLPNEYSTTIRRYSCMALTNLTFGDGKNKALLCSMRSAMEALADQLRSPNEDLVQAAASVLRNLSWRADLASKKTLREIEAVSTLMRASMSVKKETTLKSILSALWNLSSHGSENRAEICAVEGALQFLVSLLTYKSTAKTLAIVENGGGILRNVSSQIAISEDYRQILRKHECLKILLHHLRSPSLTIVSNACGTLWNLSARCEEDQNMLREMGAVSMLRNLIHSRHKMISSGSSAALRNLLSSVPAGKSVDNEKSLEAPRPSLHVRKLRALEAELDNSLSETCENVESPRCSPTEIVHRSESEPRRFVYHLNGGGGDVGHRKEEDSRQRRQIVQQNPSENSSSRVSATSGQVVRTGSQDSVGSTHSDISHDRTRAHTMLAKSSLLLHKRQGSSLDRKDQQAIVHNGTPRPNNSQDILNEHKAHNSAGTINNTPAHVRQHHLAGLQQQHPQQLQNTQGWQTMPNSRIVKYMREVALYAGVEPAGTFHGHTSLTQSAPAHSQPFHYPIFPNTQNQSHSLLERLAKPSAGLSSSCNLNSTSGNSAGSDYNTHGSMSSAAEGETDQPVNYSLKYQDGSVGDKNNKSSSIGNVHTPYTHLASVGSSLNLRSAAMPEHMRSRVINEHAYLLNNSNVHDKMTPNKPGTNSLLNQAILPPHRPVPNLVHNRFQTPRGYQSVGAGQHPQFMTPQKAYPVPSFHPRGYLYSSTLPSESPHQSLPLNVSSNPGYSPQAKPFNTAVKQFNKVKTAHQNQPHLRPIQQFSAYAETDLDLVVDQPTDFSLRYNEVSEETCSDEFQEQPINYSMRFCDSGGREGPQLGPYLEDSHCVECKYAEARRTNERIEISSNDDQVRTFCTEGTPYLSTATSLTDLTQAGKIDREEEEADEDGQDKETNKKMGSADVERGGSRPDVHPTSGSSVSKGTERHTCSTLTGSARGDQEFMSSNAGSQLSDQHIVQQSFHADNNEGSLDQTKTYCEEGTPLCFSRVSSLSSLHFTEPRENGGQSSSSSTEKAELACIDEADSPEALVISVIENKEAASSSAKAASSIKRAPTDQVLKGDKEAKTVTFDENNQIEETPLMFSRCSSPESLSSFDTQSVHSSVISEYSRRASEVVSPSEIPDSPSESMPPSPRQTHSPSRRFKDFPPTPKSMNIVSKQPHDFDKTPSTVKGESFGNFSGFDEEDKPINFAIRNPEIPNLHTFSAFDDDQPIDFSFVQRQEEQSNLAFSAFQKGNQNANSHLPSKLLTPRAKTVPAVAEQNAETESSSGKSEVPVVYAEEGTPPNFSETTSLSGITMASSSTRGGGDKHSYYRDQDVTRFNDNDQGLEFVPKNEAPTNAVKEGTPSKAWSPVKEQLKYEDRDSSMSDVSEGEEDILAQCISSGMPTPASSARKMRRSSSDNTVKRKSGIPMKTAPETRSQNSGRQSPILKPVAKKLPFSKSPSDMAKSDNSSVENEDILLSQMIESGMPKSKPSRKFTGGADHSGAAGESGKQSSRDSNTSAFIPRTSTITVVAPFHDFVPTDSVRTYNVEDTPRNFSNATSLSDLTIDSDGSKSACTGLTRSPKAGKGFHDNKMDSKQSPSKLLSTHLGNKLPAKGRSSTRPIPRDSSRGGSNFSTSEVSDYITFSPPSNDTLHTYGVEGTPVTFSRNDSLSSLCGGKDSRGTGSGISASPRKDNRFDKDESDSSCSLPKERHVIGQSSEDSSVAGDRADRPIKFCVEDTPVCFSRNSSLSSLNSLDKVEQPETALSGRKDCKESTVLPGKAAKSAVKQSVSCDSLSDELADCDPTPSEQALLEQCINSAMPKSRLPKGDERTRRHTKAKLLSQKVGVARSSNTASPGVGLTKSASLEMPSGIMNGSHSGSDVDHGSQGSLIHSRHTSANLMTRSCSDTTELDLSFQNPPPSSRKSRYSNWHRQRHWPQEGGQNNFHLGVRSKNNDSVSVTIPHEETEPSHPHNVHLATSETQAFKMSGSTVEEDFFIDNETISLVSNDYASDTNSGISFTMSGFSDRNFERSSGNNSEDQVPSVRTGGPRFVTPGASQRPVKKGTTEEEEVKVVKGRRKPLYPKTSSSGTAANGNVKVRTSPGKGVASLAGNKGVPLVGADKSNTCLKKTPPKNSTLAQISPKSASSEGGGSKNGSPPQKSTGQRSGSSTPPEKSVTSSSSGNKVATKTASPVVPPQVNRSKLVKGKTATTSPGSKISTNTGTNSQPCLPSDSSPCQSSSLTYSVKSPGQSRLPTATSSNKTSPALNGSNKGSKPGMHLTTSPTSSTSHEKKTCQITPKYSGEALSNGALSHKGSGSSIPTRKSNSSGSSPVPSSSDLSKQTQSDKHTPPGTAVKKHTPSKIATFKRRDDSQDGSSLRDSPVSSASSSSSRLPIFVMKSSPATSKPSSLPPSGLKSKAATLPNSSFTSSKSRSVDDRISKSSTYEKISSDLDHGMISNIAPINVLKVAETNSNLKLNSGSFDSPESGVRRGEIFELCDEYDNCEPSVNRTAHYSTNGQSSLTFNTIERVENNALGDLSSNRQDDVKLIQNSTSGSLDSFDRSMDRSSHIDSSTFRRKKPAVSNLEFELPNADDTCRSMCSFNDSFGSPQANNSTVGSHSGSFCDENTINESAESSIHDRCEIKIENKSKHAEEKTGGKAKSIVAQGLKKLFSGRHKDKEKAGKIQGSEKDSNKSKNPEKEAKIKHSKSKSKDKKNWKDKKEIDILQSNIKIEPTLVVDEKLMANQGTNTVVSGNHATLKEAGFDSLAANNSCSNHLVFSAGDDQASEISEEGCLTLPSERHMTKTEMLLARRRRTNLSNSVSDGGRGKSEVAGCMVTTV